MRDPLASPRRLFSGPTGETIRAFVIFGVLMAILAVMAADLAFRQLSVEVLRQRIDVGRNEAEAIAREVATIGSIGEGEIDDSRLRQRRAELAERIRRRIVGRLFIRHVEVRDRFGGRIIYVAGRAGGAPRPGVPRARLPVSLPPSGEELIQVPLAGRAGRPAGEVRLGLAPAAVHLELEQLGRSLLVKLGLAAGLAALLLVAMLFYVLHLIRRNRRLEQARQSAARSSYVGLLASGLAHEIRNPLNAMNINLQMLEEELLLEPAAGEGEWHELLESTKSEIKRLERLVNNFLAYARPAPPRFEARDLNGVVQEVVRLLEVDFRKSGVELVTDLEPLLPDVEIDDTQLKQALINLLVNARQVLRDHGRVTVRTRAGSRGEAVVEVIDDGPGIPEEARERIFEVFYSSRGGGTGLGLPIARQIVERHGGAIELETAIGRGTTFRIRLPRRHAQPAAAPVEPSVEGASR